MNPRLVFWETTRSCNLGCPHCRASAQDERSPQELSTAEGKRFLDEVASVSKPILVFSGGEPLLREDIFELSEYATSLGVKTAIATNATLVDEAAAKRLKESGIKIAAVSIYGPDRDSHNAFIGKPGVFKETVRGLNKLKDADIPIQINTTITKKNLDQLEALEKFALDCGACSYHVFFLVPTGRGKSMEGDDITPKEYEEAFNRLYDIQSGSSLRIKATCAPHYYRVLLERSSNKIKKPSSSFGAITKGCLAGQSVCFVSHKGGVFGCGYLPIAAGDLRKDDFKKIWASSELFNELRDDSKLQGKCGICEFKRVCSGCRARAYAATGNYLEEEPECVYQPLTGKS